MKKEAMIGVISDNLQTAGSELKKITPKRAERAITPLYFDDVKKLVTKSKRLRAEAEELSRQLIKK